MGSLFRVLSREIDLELRIIHAEPLKEGEQVIEYADARVPVSVEGINLRVYISEAEDPKSQVVLNLFDCIHLNGSERLVEGVLVPEEDGDWLLSISDFESHRPRLSIEYHHTKPETSLRVLGRERE